MKSLPYFSCVALLLAATPAALLSQAAAPPSFSPVPAFPLDAGKVAASLSIARPVQPTQPFTVAGQRGILVGSQDGQFESWILPVKLLSHLNIEAQIDGYSVPISVNQQAAQIDVRPDHTTLTYAHIGFTLRQIMYSPDNSGLAGLPPGTGPVVLFQIEAVHPMQLTFRFTPEMRWMWPKRNDGIPSAEWVKSSPGSYMGYYVLHMDYPDLAGAVTIPGAEPGILAPYQERPQDHQVELILHYDPKRDRDKYFPLLMAVGTSPAAAQVTALGQTLAALNTHLADSYAAHAKSWADFLATSTSIETPDRALNDAFRWGEVSIEQLKAKAYPTGETGLVAGYYASGDSARPGFGWFFGRDSLYTLYAVNGFGDFALTRDELNFLIARQRDDGKIMHEYSQTAADPVVQWKSFPYMYAAADSTPLFLMAMRDYLRASGDLAWIQANRAAIEKAWAFETAATSDTDHDGIYDNSQGTGWVESWPLTPDSGSNNSSGMPHQEVYMAALDAQASAAFADLESALGDKAQFAAANARAAKVHATLESEYANPAKGCYDFSHNFAGNDKTTTVYPAVAWWDAPAPPSGTSMLKGTGFSPYTDSPKTNGALAPEGPLTHAADCLRQFASPGLATDWGLRDVDASEPIFDGMSYHQGSVWPLFTGWGSLAEYRGNQPLAGQQMLMQNVDLTWAQDPGAVTELLSGDTYVPFGRSTSHQLWSSAMVITPTLRGLFGISLDAATNTITLNPHLPAGWNHLTVRNLHLGATTVSLHFMREGHDLTVTSSDPSVHLVTPADVPSHRTPAGSIAIPLPPVELGLLSHALPAPGSAPAQLKVVSTELSAHSLTAVLTAPAGSSQQLLVTTNQPVTPHLTGPATLTDGPATVPASQILDINFPTGTGWQTTKITLTW